MAIKITLQDGTTKEFETHESALDFVTGQLTAEQSAHDVTKKALKDAKDPKAILARVKDRTDLLATARKVLGDAAEEMEDASDNEVKLAVIKKTGAKLPEGASQDMIDGAYFVAKSSATADAEPPIGEENEEEEEEEEAPSADAKKVGDARDFKRGTKSRDSRNDAPDDGSAELSKALRDSNSTSGFKFAMSK